MSDFISGSILDHVKENSDHCIKEMRIAAEELFHGRTDLIIGVNGSVARREFTVGSDIDLFFIGLDKSCQGIDAAQEQYRARLVEHDLKMPSEGGVFEAPQTREELLGPIGGQKDTNTSITRRMLFLLEGEWIFNQLEFERLRADLIAEYVPENFDNTKLCLYLLNDIIRYWRTICVDFEYKTGRGKPRAIRSIKLRTSRMLLYFAGAAAVAHAIDMPAAEKRDELIRLFSLPAIARLNEIYGDDFSAAFEQYGKFLSRLDDSEVRKTLEKGEGLNTPEFAELSELARQFKEDLLKLIKIRHTFDSPLVNALLL
jgi:hypothetical protein